MGSVGTEIGYLTVESVGKMTTYDLRQEAERRGLLAEMPDVNHATLLQRVVQVIVKEEHERGRLVCEDVPAIVSWSGPASTTQDRVRMQKDRSERKAAAIKRSEERQADPTYFKAKALSNVREKMEVIVNELLPSKTDEEEETRSAVNPLRHKVFVR